MLLRLLRRLYYWILSFRRSGVHYIGGNESLPKPLSREEEREMLLAFMDGDEHARDVLIERNLRLVVYIARRFDQTNTNI